MYMNAYIRLAGFELRGSVSSYSKLLKARNAPVAESETVLQQFNVKSLHYKLCSHGDAKRKEIPLTTSASVNTHRWNHEWQSRISSTYRFHQHSITLQVR